MRADNARQRTLYESLSLPRAPMSLLSRPGLDTKSWWASLRAAGPAIILGIIGVIIAWLSLRVASQGLTMISASQYTTQGPTIQWHGPPGMLLL